MIQSYTLRTVPFRIMRPTLKTLMASALMVLGQVEVDKKLALKIILLRDKTNALENPTRNQMQTHMVAWYGVANELSDAIAVTYPELAGLLRNVVKEADWLEDAWVYMQEKMQAWHLQNVISSN